MKLAEIGFHVLQELKTYF